MTPQELHKVLANRFPNKLINVMHSVSNIDNVNGTWTIVSTMEHLSIRVAANPPPEGNITCSTWKDFSIDASLEHIIATLAEGIAWWEQRIAMDALHPKERKLRQVLAIKFCSTTSADKVKERAAKLMTMSDMGLMMMLGNMGVKQSTIQEIINSK